MAQDIGDIAPGEMHPVHLCLVGSVIFIFLNLPWTEQHHMSRRDDLLSSVQMEMGTPSGDIEQLKVQPAPGPVGGELRSRIQTVRPAAVYDQWPAPVLEFSSSAIAAVC